MREDWTPGPANQRPGSQRLDQWEVTVETVGTWPVMGSRLGTWSWPGQYPHLPQHCPLLPTGRQPAQGNINLTTTEMIIHQPPPRVTPTLIVVKDTGSCCGWVRSVRWEAAGDCSHAWEGESLPSVCCSLGTAASFSHCKNVQLQIFAETGIMVTSGLNQAPELSWCMGLAGPPKSQSHYFEMHTPSKCSF